MVFEEADIRRALEEEEFFPVFQPLVELRTGRLAGFEMLARWRHRQLGLIAPDNFISTLERYLLTDGLTRSLLKQAFGSPVLKASSLTLAVNFSPLQLLGTDVAQRLADVAAAGDFSLNRLTIEVTESALLDDLPQAQAAARDLKALGCKLALDDFGTGYSSLRHLHAFPFDELKVDRSFVSSMTGDRRSRKTVAAVVGLGESLGLTTVAEGVETQEQANMLLWLGCDEGQGWLYGKPVAADDLERTVQEICCQPACAMPMALKEDSLVSQHAHPSQRLAQLQAIYDGVPVGLCLLDRKLRYVSLNQRLAEMNGVPLVDHLGRTVREVIPQVFSRVEGFIRRALQGEPINGVEVRKAGGEGIGEVQTLMSSYQPAFDEAGEVIGVSVAVMDVTGYKRTEEALRESENHYRHMVRLNPHMPWVLNSRGEVIDGSPRWQEFTGQPLGEAIGNGWLKMLHPDDVEPTLRAIRTTLATGEPMDVEYRVRRPGEEWRWMRSRGAPRFSESGEIVSVYGLVEEVHPQRQVTEELEICQTQLRAAINACPIAMLVADAHDCTVFMINPAAREILGSLVFAGQKLSEYTHLPVTTADGRRLKPEEFPIFRSLMHGELVEAQHLVYQRAGGGPVDLSVTSRPILADDGRLIGCVVMLREDG